MGNINKKKRLKDFIRMLVIILTTILSSGSIFQTHAASVLERIRIELEGLYLSQYFSKVHFNVGGNDFGGGFIWLPVQNKKNKERTTLSVSGTNNTLTCATQVRGFYYNSQRGERLWPLDETSLGYLTGMGAPGYENLQMTGGLYTNCGTLQKIGTNLSTSGDVLGIYGFLQYTLGDEKSGLIAGVDYDAEKNTIKSGANFQCNLQRLNNSYPFGYIYDDHGHIGLVGAKISSTYMSGQYTTVFNFHNKLNSLGFQGDNCISTYFGYDGENAVPKENQSIPGFGIIPQDFFDFGKGNAKTTIFTLGIKGTVGLTEELTSDQKTFFEQNQMSSTLLLRTESNIADIVNKAYKKAEILCRDKRESSRDSNKDLICLKDLPSNKLTNCGTPMTCMPSDFSNKTVIIKEGDVYLNIKEKNTSPINIFIEKGNLFLVNSGNISSHTCFDDYGYIKNPCYYENGTLMDIEGNYLKGNFIINGLILPKDSTTSTELHALENRLIIHGKLVSFNSLLEPTKTRIDAIKQVLGSSYYNDNYEGYIAFPNLFNWECNGATGKASDNTRCAGFRNMDANSTLVNKAFGIIDMDIPSKLD